MISTMLDPPIGFRHWKFPFLVYTLLQKPRLLPSGELEPEHATLMASSTFLRVPRARGTFKGWIPEVDTRRAILEKLGYLYVF